MSTDYVAHRLRAGTPWPGQRSPVVPASIDRERPARALMIDRAQRIVPGQSTGCPVP
jgi:hypothetical protein